MTAPVIDPATVELRPGTRWVRLLLILRGGTFTVGGLLQASRLQGVAHKIERNRISQAVRRMADHGLTQYLHGEGWTATEHGRAAAERYLMTITPAKPAAAPTRPVRPSADVTWLDIADRDRRETHGRPAKRQKLRAQKRAA